MHDAGTNPGVLAALENIGGVSSDMSSVLGAPPAPPPPAVRGRGNFATQAAAAGADAKAQAEQDRQALSEAQAAKGLVGHAAKKFPWLTGKVPGAQRVRVRQRNGAQLVTIGDYSKSDVESSPDIESFVSTYLRPQYGGGEYQIFLIDEIGKEMDGGIVRFPEPAKNPFTATTPVPDVAAGMMPLMVEMYRNSTKPVPTPDPFQQMKTMKEFLMDTQPKPANNDSLFASMLQMQSAAAAENQKLLITLMGSRSQGPDPAVTAITALLERMDRRLEKLETAPPPMAPPPMMPPPGPGYTMPELLTAITGAVGVIVPLLKGDSVKPTELAQLVLSAQAAAAPKDGFGVRDVIEIFKDREAATSPPATLEDQIGTLVRVKELAAAIAPPSQQSAPTGTTFWDAAIAILGNGSEISKAIGSRVDQSLQPKHVQVTENRQMPQQQAPQPPQIQPNVVPAEEGVRLPANFPEKMTALETATTPGGRIEATVDALMSLRGIDQWNSFTQKLLVAVAQNDIDASMKLLGGWLKMLMEGGLLKRETALSTLAAFKDSFAIVRVGLLEKVPMLQPIARQADAQAAQAAQAAARAQAAAQGAAQPAAPTEQEAAGADEGGEEEPDESKPTGPAPVLVDLGHDAEVAAYTG